MTQLIENKPPRRALIATLSHFYTSRRFRIPSSRHGGACPERYRFVGRSFSSDLSGEAQHAYPRQSFVGRSFSSDITDDARSAYRCAGPMAACSRLCDRSSKCRISNRQVPRLGTHLNPCAASNQSLLIANFRVFFRSRNERLLAACTRGRKLPTMMSLRMWVQ
jgi:hypothetical protein